MAKNSIAYPVSFSVDYPEGKRNRLTSFFRLFMVIPIYIIVALLAGVVFGRKPGRELHTVYGWTGSFTDCADDPFPAQISQMVVRLEPGFNHLFSTGFLPTCSIER